MFWTTDRVLFLVERRLMGGERGFLGEGEKGREGDCGVGSN